MKRNALLITMTGLFLLLMTFGFFGSHRGDVRNVSREIGFSQIYSSAEIEAAMDLAQEHFQKEFEGCHLLTLSYDENYSEKFSEDWAEQYNTEQAIVLLSNFVTGRNSGGFNPNDYYSNWQWILTRNSGEPWQLQTWGYG